MEATVNRKQMPDSFSQITLHRLHTAAFTAAVNNCATVFKHTMGGGVIYILSVYCSCCSLLDTLSDASRKPAVSAGASVFLAGCITRLLLSQFSFHHKIQTGPVPLSAGRIVSHGRHVKQNVYVKET